MDESKRLVIITGISGAGKSLAINVFEDLDYYCVDNLPPKLLPQVLDMWEKKEDAQDLAVVIDIRSGNFFNDLLSELNKLKETPHYPYSKPCLLFLNSNDAELIKRFKETRRKHPLVNIKTGIIDAIAKERKLLEDINESADKTIDTTNLEPEEFRRLLREFFGPKQPLEKLMVSVVSFGFKHGVPLDADLVFDVRFLANPYWVQDLRALDGTSAEVYDYVLSDPLTEPLLEKLFDLVEFSIPQYIREGKAYLTIAIGCTGGRHRSVVIASELARFLQSANYNVRVEHRDLPRSRGKN
ncbi:MAG: RNase adapter RapZ [Armatimonadota bacterium]